MCTNVRISKFVQRRARRTYRPPIVGTHCPYLQCIHPCILFYKPFFASKEHVCCPTCCVLGHPFLKMNNTTVTEHIVQLLRLMQSTFIKIHKVRESESRTSCIAIHPIDPSKSENRQYTKSHTSRIKQKLHNASRYPH